MAESQNFLPPDIFETASKRFFSREILQPLPPSPEQPFGGNGESATARKLAFQRFSDRNDT
ncbi:MAG: hypothetical protein R2941_20685 [Desulfobacterales bacterium]